MARQKKRYKVEGWIPRLEVKVDEWTWSTDEENAKRNVRFKKKLPAWSIVYMEAWEVPPKESDQQRLF
ncbi:MAG: hypothetical protein R3251_03835 [Candidatus Spechtbacterales bacterium]|nr:hypothetical protein [Candidatus Spechtbacterales bacterium]